jgi:tetratricopeptide (TPR) repeat protein
MGQYVGFLVQQDSQNSELAATLTVRELANLLALLEWVEAAGEPEAVIDLATSLHQLFQWLGRPRLQARLARALGTAEQALGGQWGHAAFEAWRTRIEQQLAAGQLQAAFDGARALPERAGPAGEGAYAEADYDLAMAHILLARVLLTAGGAEQALPLLEAARGRFEVIAQAKPGRGAERMASACLTQRGDCLLYLGRLDAAAAAYEEAIRRGDAMRRARRGRAQWPARHRASPAGPPRRGPPRPGPRRDRGPGLPAIRRDPAAARAPNDQGGEPSLPQMTNCRLAPDRSLTPTLSLRPIRTRRTPSAGLVRLSRGAALCFANLHQRAMQSNVSADVVIADGLAERRLDLVFRQSDGKGVELPVPERRVDHGAA